MFINIVAKTLVSVNMDSGFVICQQCHINNGKGCIHCSVCSRAYHFTCISPGMSDKDAGIFENFTGLHWYCPDHRQLTVHSLLDRLSSCEKKLMSQHVDFDLCFQPPSEKTSKTNHAKDTDAPDASKRRLRDRKPKDPESSSRAHKDSVTNSPLPVVPKVKGRKALPTVKEIAPPETSSSSCIPNLDILQGVPPPKRVFVSRLSSNATVDLVDSYLKSKNIPVGYKIEKFKLASFKDYTSFVINVTSDDLFKQLMNPDFWPAFTIAREFFRKRQKLFSTQ